MDRFIKVHYLDDDEPTLLNSSSILLIDRVDITRDNITQRCTRILFYNNTLKTGHVKESVEEILSQLEKSDLINLFGDAMYERKSKNSEMSW